MSGTKVTPDDAYEYPTADELEAWLVGKPAVVIELARRVPTTTCYRMRGNEGHYVVASYAENGTFTLAHGRDSYLPGVGVFGITPDEVIPCGCGRWQWPTAEQRRATDARIERQHARLVACGDPKCEIHARRGRRRPRGKA
jgi:hypothetical protein